MAPREWNWRERPRIHWPCVWCATRARILAVRKYWHRSQGFSLHCEQCTHCARRGRRNEAPRRTLKVSVTLDRESLNTFRKAIVIFLVYLSHITCIHMHKYCNDSTHFHVASNTVCRHLSDYKHYHTFFLEKYLCPYLETPANGNITLTRTSPGDTATYTCNTNYDLVGDNILTCRDDGHWKPNPPVCLRK